MHKRRKVTLTANIVCGINIFINSIMIVILKLVLTLYDCNINTNINKVRLGILRLALTI